MSDRVKKLAEWVVRSIEAEPGELPVFPAVAMRIVDLLESGDAEMTDAASLISQDQVIASKILRTANSALYRGASQMTTVGEAVMRIGLKESGQIAMTAACRSLFDVEDRAELEIHPPVWGAIWHQSLVCSYGGRLIARELQVGDPEQVFLGALMRHVGRLLVLKTIARGMVHGKLRGSPTEEELENVMGRLERDIGVGYLRQNNLPDVFIAAAADGLDSAAEHALGTKSIEILRLADGLANVIEIAPFARGYLDAEGLRAAMALGLDKPRLEYFVLQFQSLSEQVRELL